MKNSILVFSLIIFLFTACGEDEKWGIDDEPIKEPIITSIPVCDNGKNKIMVYKDQIIEKRQTETVVRIWHYQNGDKMICVVQGDAVVYAKNSQK